MTDRADAGGGFTVLDGVALVTGAAVALVHIRTAVPSFDGLVDWAWAWCLFAWLSVTCAGPVVYLVRRFFTRPNDYPAVGDRLWLIIGLPWLIAAAVRSGETTSEMVSGRLDPAYVGCLSIGLTLTTLVAIVVLVKKYLLVDPTQPRPAEFMHWTNRLGLILAVAWPVQVGVGLVVVG